MNNKGKDIKFLEEGSLVKKIDVFGNESILTIIAITKTIAKADNLDEYSMVKQYIFNRKVVDGRVVVNKHGKINKFFLHGKGSGQLAK